MEDHLLKKLNSVSSLIGNTPLIQIPNDHVNLFAKLESFNLLDNVKMRPAFFILKKGIEDGSINQDTCVIESSSGNFGLSLASLCSSLGIKFIPVIDPNINPTYEKMLELLSFKVVKVEKRDDTGGFLKTRLEMVQTLKKKYENSFWTNQYGNIDNFNAHYWGLGKELVDSGVNFDYLFAAVSTTGTISGVSTILKEKQPDCQTIAVDVEGSVIFGSTPKSRHIPGIGSSIQPDLLSKCNLHDVNLVNEIEGIKSCWELLKKHNLFVGGSAGCVYQATQNHIENNLEEIRNKNIVMIFADGGFPYIDTIYNKNWVTEKFKEEM
ncbi:2,3-diaminopropionate biosynthesis protein SbnA [Enterococcus termitis]|nr:2,3-diaminopropionate biosynthesis protein SbnA [Enterococcus termitis]